MSWMPQWLINKLFPVTREEVAQEYRKRCHEESCSVILLDISRNSGVKDYWVRRETTDFCSAEEVNLYLVEVLSLCKIETLEAVNVLQPLDSFFSLGLAQGVFTTRLELARKPAQVTVSIDNILNHTTAMVADASEISAIISTKDVLFMQYELF